MSKTRVLLVVSTALAGCGSTPKHAEMVNASGGSWDDTDGMVNHARSIKGVECGVLITPAKRGGTRVSMRSKGHLAPGSDADLVVLDPATIEVRATFKEPARFPRGIDHVFIGGKHVVNEERYDADAYAGRVIRA